MFFGRESKGSYDKREGVRMKCFICNGEVIWGGDFDNEDYGLEGSGIVSNYTCSKCQAYYEVFVSFVKEGV